MSETLDAMSAFAPQQERSTKRAPPPAVPDRARGSPPAAYDNLALQSLMAPDALSASLAMGGASDPVEGDADRLANAVPGLPHGLNKEVPVTLPDGTVGRADRACFIYDADGDRIGAHVYEIKPNTPDDIARGQKQAQQYVAGLRAEIEQQLRAKGEAIPTVAPDGSPLYSGPVVIYNYEQLMSVLRALRASRRDAARMAELHAIARQVFGSVP